MDKPIYQAHSSDALCTTTRKAQCDLQIFTPTIKQEIVQCMDEEETRHNDCMYRYKPVESHNRVNHYDNQFCVSEEVKKELPEDECSQSSTSAPCIKEVSINSKIAIKNEKLSKVPETQELNQENSEEAFSFIKTGEICDEKNQIIVKQKISEEHRILDIAGVSNVLHELPTIQEIQPRMCGGIFKKRLNLLTHSSEHLQVEPPTVGDESNVLGKCECNSEYFNNHNSNELLTSHKCNLCEHIVKRTSALVQDTKNAHYDSGKIFECWCGKLFRTSKLLTRHKYQLHGGKEKKRNNAALEEDFQCDICKKIFHRKGNLRRHVTSIHYDYGKTFECWCGKQFPSPIHLYDHKYRRHRRKVEKENKAVIKKEFQCDICKKIFKSKEVLKTHIKSIHYDYGKTFECQCGKQFRSPRHLYQHKSSQHPSDDKIRIKMALKPEFQCDICKKMYKTKGNLKTHIISIHYDYGKSFECWCGKQFRTPAYLSDHKFRLHGPKVKKTNKSASKKQFQCDVCKKFLKRKNDLRRHMTMIHYDYGRIFECWCGKQFRIPLYLKKHQRDQHNRISKNKNKKKYECDDCELVFKNKRNLASHVNKKHR